MTIEKTLQEKELTLILRGRLDTINAPLLEAELKEHIADIQTLVLDFAGIEYISSAGLRVLLAAQRVMNQQGRMVLRNINDTVNEVFEITGFCDILTIE